MRKSLIASLERSQMARDKDGVYRSNVAPMDRKIIDKNNGFIAAFLPSLSKEEQNLVGKH